MILYVFVKLYNYNKEVARSKQNEPDFFTAGDSGPVNWRLARIIKKEPMMSFKKAEESNKIREFVAVLDEEICVGAYKVNISRLDTLVSRQQMAAAAFIIRALFNRPGGRCDLAAEVKNIYAEISENGFDSLYSSAFGVDFNMELPAPHDILFAVSRMDGLIYE